MLTYRFEMDGESQVLEMIFVEETRGRPFLFGEGDQTRSVEVADFYIARFPVTQALWKHVMGSNPSIQQGNLRPVENVSWVEVTQPGGFLDQLNFQLRLAGNLPSDGRFQLPSETEWEYAARGGPQWTEGFRFSGGSDIQAVAWFKDNSGDAMHDVGQKASNQLGLYDMSGNAWEWCQDCHTPDVSLIPADGRPFVDKSNDRILRGGCFHNWAIHCTVSKRYAIDKEYRDGCIGLRVVFGP